MSKFTTEYFIERAKVKHGDKYDYSLTEYKNTYTKVKIICPEHGEFEQHPSTHLRGFGCKKCSGQLINTTEEFIFKAKEVHGEKYDYSLVNYIGSRVEVKIICPIHGEFEQRPDVHIISSTGCTKCSNKQPSKEEFIKKAKEVHGEKYDYSMVDYVNNKFKVKIICDIHGIFEQIPDNHISKKHGCPKCNSSKGEIRVKEWLEKNNISFEEQKKFIDCKNKRPLPFDFYLPEQNVCIEFDGAQHFKPGYWSKDTQKNTDGFNYTKQNDLIKNDYCNTKGIHLIRIPYWDLNRIDTYLESLK